MSLNGVIGIDGHLPWYFKEDFQFFKNMTVNNTVIMGRKTFKSLGYKAPPDRENIIVSKTLDSQYTDVKIVPYLKEAYEMASNPDIFVIGGHNLYVGATAKATKIYLTVILENIEGDAFFPYDFLDNYKLVKSEMQDVFITIGDISKYTKIVKVELERSSRFRNDFNNFLLSFS